MVSGSPPFVVAASELPGERFGLLFYGLDGRAALPFGDGTLCAEPPLRRTPAAPTGGEGGVACSGALAFDFTAWEAAGMDAHLFAGRTVNAQFQVRDPSNPSRFGLTDGLEFYWRP